MDYSQQRKPFHLTHNSSSNASIVTVQRAASVGPGRSTSRPRVANSAQDLTDASGSGSTYPPVSLTSPESRRAPSRSNSISSGVREGVGNLNRWSQSTTSSKGSHQRSGSFSRRMSIGGGAFTFGASTSTQSPPKKLTKRQGPPAAALLAPLNTLPPFQQTSANSSSSPLTAGAFTPSTAGLLTEAIRSTVPDYFGGKWEDQAQTRDFSVKKSSSRSPLDPPASVYTIANAPITRRQTEGDITRSESRGHSRNRSQAAKSSAGTGSSRDRTSKQPSQKAMLSKALQKANTAVLLDNAQNFEGAMQAYSEACALLQQVMARSSGDEDRRKLEAIRTTYTSRISELEKIAPHLQNGGKALPARPESGFYKGDEAPFPTDEDEDSAVIETATVTRIVNDDSYFSTSQQTRSKGTTDVPRRRESLLPSALNPGPYRSMATPEPFIPRSYSRSPMRDHIADATINLGPPMESEYMPPPLSPGRRDEDPMNNALLRQNIPPIELSNSNLSASSPEKTHARAPSNESMSWLDTIDESGGSAASSVHSRSSSMGLRRKHIRPRAPSGATEAEFDAALDAAVEAAYDEGLEPSGISGQSKYYDPDDEIVANVRRKVELAKERVRQSEREAAIQTAIDTERRRIQLQSESQPDVIEDAYDGNESEEEERMLEEMTRGYVLDDFEFGLQSKSALPRESDSSGFSGRTWNSSIGSNPATVGTNLSTVSETSTQVLNLQSKTPPPVYPPPIQALPPPPSPVLGAGKGVRSRRLSGQNPKQLKIETTVQQATSDEPSSAMGPAPSQPPPRLPHGISGTQPKTAGFAAPKLPLQGASKVPMPQSARQPSSAFPGPSPSEIVSPPTPTLNQSFSNDSDGAFPRSGSPNRSQSRAGLRKNFSSSSLKALKGRNLSVTNVDELSETSLNGNTPMSSQFATAHSRDGRLPAMPTLPTPIAAAFKEKLSAPNGGLYLFNQDMHTPESPGSPNPLNTGAPIPLEPCPNEALLRPFWLMRALYQTIAHPRGGYLSTKLFVPRDVWRVKGVKIKGVEDKIANCDFLTAALMKLGQVDSYDADAVFEEMQAFENVLEQAQITLSKKLGNEVGVQGSGGLFKDASPIGDSEAGTAGSKSGSSMASKTSSFSWRRLRSKNSGVNLSNAYSNKNFVPDVPKENITMSTLPMTSLTTIRFAKRDISQVQFSGPHANYMSALAKLFDAAQVIDQIARQVDDPGLRHADKTQVGLELCTRHAAEFFGFYICRFVLNDISMLLDKFIKRGSEWVLV
ncbi:MIT domain-containing protein [Phlyctema vagabunda]|uniref:MIT domain-containing protein n=1 Tax=Phlyctema vagabunda TaxID=108571 RepID=A0ABR4PM20_9HELO